MQTLLHLTVLPGRPPLPQVLGRPGELGGAGWEDTPICRPPVLDLQMRRGSSDINLAWSLYYSISYCFISFYVISFYFTGLVVFATNLLLGSLQLLLITAAVPRGSPPQGCLEDRGAYVRGLGKLTETVFVCLMFY